MQFEKTSCLSVKIPVDRISIKDKDGLFIEDRRIASVGIQMGLEGERK